MFKIGGKFGDGLMWKTRIRNIFYYRYFDAGLVLVISFVGTRNISRYTESEQFRVAGKHLRKAVTVHGYVHLLVY